MSPTPYRSGLATGVGVVLLAGLVLAIVDVVHTGGAPLQVLGLWALLDAADRDRSRASCSPAATRRGAPAGSAASSAGCAKTPSSIAPIAAILIAAVVSRGVLDR